MADPTAKTVDKWWTDCICKIGDSPDYHIEIGPNPDIPNVLQIRYVEGDKSDYGVSVPKEAVDRFIRAVRMVADNLEE